MLVSAFQELSRVLHLKVGDAKGGCFLIFISKVNWSFAFGFYVVVIPFQVLVSDC